MRARATSKGPGRCAYSGSAALSIPCARNRGTVRRKDQGHDRPAPSARSVRSFSLHQSKSKTQSRYPAQTRRVICKHHGPRLPHLLRWTALMPSIRKISNALLYPLLRADDRSTAPEMLKRTSFEIRFRPITRRALEVARQYNLNPARCQPTTVSGLTTMRACFQPGQNPRAKTQKILSNARSLSLGCFRFRTACCCRRTRFSNRRVRRACKHRKMVVTNSQSMRNVGLCYRKDCVDFNEPFY
jgi:hypothetical protein